MYVILLKQVSSIYIVISSSPICPEQRGCLNGGDVEWSGIIR